MIGIDKIIKERKYPQILLLFGEEEFLIEEDYLKLYKHLLNLDPSKSDFDIFDGDEHNIEQIISSCLAYPFVSQYRVVVVNNFDKLFQGRISKKTEQSSPFAQYLSNPMLTTILILKGNVKKLAGISVGMSGGNLSAKAQKTIESSGFPYNIIFTKYHWIEYPKVWDNQFAAWVVKRIKSHNKSMDSHASELLVMHCNPSLRDIAGEIDKLMIYLGEKNSISSEDINALIGTNREFNVYELQKAIGKRDLSKSIMILENMLSIDRKEMLIMTVLINYFTTLLKLIEEAPKNSNKFQLAGILRVSPAFVQDYLDTLKLYSVREIERAFNLLCEVDETLKSTSTDSTYLMEKMLIKIINR